MADDADTASPTSSGPGPPQSIPTDPETLQRLVQELLQLRIQEEKRKIQEEEMRIKEREQKIQEEEFKRKDEKRKIQEEEMRIKEREQKIREEELKRKEEELNKREEEISRKNDAKVISQEPGVPPTDEEHQTTGANVGTLLVHRQVEDLPSKFPRTETVEQLPGLLDDDSKGLTVVFHAILPCDEWQYTEQHFRVHVRFDQSSLGLMNENCGSASLRKCPEGYVVAVIPIKLNIAFLQHSKALKYVYAVYSNLLTNDISELEEMPEDIRGEYDDATIFRRLKVPKEKCVIGGIYHHYDALVYPGKKRTHLSTMAIKYVTALKHEIGATSMECHGKSRKCISLSEQHEVCLKLYLSDDEMIINFDKYSSAVSVEEGVEQLLGIMKCLQSFDMYIKSSCNRVCRREIGTLHKSLQKWLLQKSKIIVESSDVKHELNWLIKGAIIVLCLKKIDERVLSDLKPEEACLILKLLKLSPNLKMKVCRDYDVFIHVLHQQSRLPVVNAIETLCQVKFSHQSIHVLLEALPLQHFLLPWCKPFGNFDLRIWLEKFHLQHLRDVRAVFKKQRNDLRSLYSQLRDVSIMDPYLPVVLVYILPVKELDSFLNVLPTFLAFCGITKRLYDFQVQKEHTERLVDYREALTTLKQMVENQIIESGTQPELVHPAMITVKIMLEKGNFYNLPEVQLTLELLLRTPQSTTCEELKPLLECWIQKKDVVGGTQFGGGESCSKVNPKGLKQELKLWQTLADVSCPASIRNRWKGIVKVIVYSRVKQLSPNSMTSLFESLNTHGTESVVDEAVLEVIEKEFDKMDKKLKERLISPNNGHAPFVVSRQICEHCKDGNVTLKDLICWDNWTIFLDTYGNKPLSDEHAEALLLSAKKEMERICKAINDGNVLVNEMRMIRQQMRQMNSLLKIYKNQSTPGHSFDTSRNACKMDRGLVSRLAELESLETTQAQLFTLYTHMERAWLCEVLRDLKREAEMDLGEKPMKAVVYTMSEQSDVYYYPYFSTIPFVTPVHKDLHEAANNSEEHDVFLALCKCTPQTPSDISSVRDWFKSIKVRCAKILKDSRDLTLSVRESRELFSGFPERKTAGELKTLSELSGNKIGSEQSTAKAIFESIQYYEILHYSAEAATILSDVATYFHCDCKTKLFQDSEQIKRMCSKTTLADCRHSEEELQICSKFKPFRRASTLTKDAMKALIKSSNLLEWLKKNIKDVNDVHQFTDLASCTEVALDALKYQMLSDLGAVIATFGPLIYETECEMNLDDFLEIVKRVWQSLDRTSEPVDRVLFNCNEQVKWYDDVRKSHGSVESSTQGHVKLILRCGIYNIGISNPNCTKYLCVSCNSEDTTSKMSYSADDLQDLNSTLYLMRMSGDVKDKMELFQKSLAAALETGHVLSELQQNGNPRYTGSVFHVKCSADVEILKDLALCLRAELQEWIGKVQAMRDSIYELSYFTTKQILRLQVGLFNFTSKCSAFQTETIQLLQSVSPNVKCEVLTQAIQEARDDIEQSGDDHAEAVLLFSSESEISEIKTPKEGRVSLELLRNILQCICKYSDFPYCERPYKFRSGVPSVIQTTSDKILQTLLSVYMMDTTICLPTLEEALICGENTTEEEICLFLHRALHDRRHKQVFCLVDPGRLSRKTADISFSTLAKLQRTCKPDYRLVIIITSEKHKIMFGQQDFVVSYAHPFSKVECCEYIKDQLARDSRISGANYRNRVQVYTSNRAGMGKSFQIAKIVAEIQSPYVHHTVISILTPSVTADTIVERIQSVNHLYSSVIFHFDISTEMMFQVDVLLFSFVVLGGLQDSTGQIARFRQSDMAIMEVTVTTKCPELFSLLPSQCFKSPQECVNFPDWVTMTEKPCYNRVAHALVQDSAMEVPEGEVPQLQVIYSAWNVADPTWSEISNFIKFLDYQLKCCEQSYYCSDESSLPGFKEFVTSFVIEMSKDFAASSLKGQVNTKFTDVECLEKYEVHPSRTWMTRPHPYLVFNDDGVSLTFVGFKVSATGDLLDRSGKVLKKGLISRDLLQDLRQYKVDLKEEWEKWSKKGILAKLSTMYGHNSTAEDPDENYVLTVDNFLKMLAILMRFRCDIPVVLMGETGCGKTKLIRFMTRVAKYGHGSIKNLFMLKIHGGTMEADIIDIVKKATLQVRECGLKCDIVVFFDEANTTPYIGLIKEIMCDKRMNGEQVDSRLKFIAACNPYRRHSDEMIEHLEHAALGFHITDSTEKFCSIPLRHLVYRVHDLPQSLRPLVFDFGQLDPEVENQYIKLIVTSHLMSLKNSHPELRKDANIELAMTDILHWCQNYMREQKGECSYVSLRDVVRAMKVFGFFLSFLGYIESDIDRKIENTRSFKDKLLSLKRGKVTRTKRAFALTVNVCYEVRLMSRELFIIKLCEQLQQHHCKCLNISKKFAHFQQEIKFSQEVVLENMEIPNLIAKNTALRENVFIMVVCIELRIPLFLIGKPGSSKSLARIIVQTSMKGINSKSEVTRQLKRVQMFSYQCSHISTAETIINVFTDAQKYQKGRDKNNHASVVVLDEIGLAEDSPNLPLKSLHPLLEDGTHEELEDSEDIDRVGFIGISNWALDPAKMNRGLMVIRPDPDVDELIISAKGICGDVNTPLDKYFRSLAEGYLDVIKKQGREFFGLRDFYSLIKMLHQDCQATNPTPKKFLHAIRQNFDGFGGLDSVQCFNKPLLYGTEDMQREQLDLIRDTLTQQFQSRDHRYLLLMTDNNAAFAIVKSLLANSLDITGDQPPEVMFGSGFPKDKGFVEACRNVNKIKHCMETGRTLLLLNLESVYESLYDLLNQFYTDYCGRKYVELGLQQRRMKCHVHDNFRIIIIAEEKNVYDKFPTALINRLEKHRIAMETNLEKWQTNVMTKLLSWIDDFSKVGEFNSMDAFVGYHKDVPATVVFEACRLLPDTEIRQLKETTDDKNKEMELYLEKIFELSKRLLLQTATPDAIIRVDQSKLPPDERERIHRIYFQQQNHSTLGDFLQEQLQSGTIEGFFFQITTHSELPTQLMYRNLSSQLEIRSFLLEAFDTEAEFVDAIRNALEDIRKRPLIVLQCSAAVTDPNLIAGVKHVLQELYCTPKNGVHFILIIHVPRCMPLSSHIGLQGHPWQSVHIETLWPANDDILLPLLEKPSLYSLINEHLPIRHLLHAALAFMEDTENRALVLSRYENILRLTEVQGADVSFHKVLIEVICKEIKTTEKTATQIGMQSWILKQALNKEMLKQSGTFHASLQKHIRDTLIPILANVISFTDQYSNLSLLYSTGSSAIMCEVWLFLFQCTIQIIDPKQPIMGDCFECKFPFSWIVNRTMDHLLHVAVTMVEGQADTPHHLQTVLCDVLLKDSLGRALQHEGSDREMNYLVECFFSDFVSLNHPGLSSHCHQLMCAALKRLTQSLKETKGVSLLHWRISGLYVVHHYISSELTWFRHIAVMKPDICSKIQDNDDTEMILHFSAVEVLLDMMEKDFSVESTVNECLALIYECQTHLDTILSFSSKHFICFKQQHRLQSRWSHLKALCLLAEEVVQKRTFLFKCYGILYKEIDLCPDFSEATTVSATLTAVKKMECLLDDNCVDLGDVACYFQDFFTEIISLILRENKSVPKDIVDFLLDFIFLDEPPSNVDKPSTTYPKVLYINQCSSSMLKFFIQVALKQDSKSFQVRLDEYLRMVPHNVMHDRLVLEFIQYVESHTIKIHRETLFDDQLDEAITLISSCHEDLRQHPITTRLNSTNLFAVARLRVILALLGDYLGKSTKSEVDTRVSELTLCVKKLCNDPDIAKQSDLTTGPLVYLLRQIAKKYSISVLKEVSKKEGMSWVMPDCFEPLQKEADVFFLYGTEKFNHLRHNTSALLSGRENVLQEFIQDTERDTSFLFLIVVSTLLQCDHSDKAVSELRDTVNGRLGLHPRIIQRTLSLLDNPMLLRHQHSSNIAQALSLDMILVHCNAIFSIEGTSLLEPFRKLINSPITMKEMYLPTMPQDDFTEIVQAFSIGHTSKFYKCPAGHRYVVTECGLPIEKKRCHVPGCNLKIGGKNHTLLSTNKQCDTQEDFCETGYILGMPNVKTAEAVPQRALSPVACTVMRLLLHAALIIGVSYGKKDQICKLFHPVKTDKLEMFLWNHLEEDFTVLQKALGRSIDDTVMVIHLVLHRIFQAPVGGPPVSLSKKELRASFEKDFSTQFVLPILQDLHGHLKNAYSIILKEGGDLLNSVVNEIQAKETLIQNMWCYSPTVDIKYLTPIILQRSIDSDCSALQQFFEKESAIRATKFIPVIFQLQVYLYERYHFRLDKKEAEAMKVKQLLDKAENAHQKQMLERMLEGLRSAWNLVKAELRHHGRYPVVDENNVDTIDQETPLDYIIPTTVGHGVCTVSLLDFLVCTHNEFINTCHQVITNQNPSLTDAWRKFEVPLHQIQQCHLIDHENHLVPIILANVRCMLKVGMGDRVECNPVSIQRRVINKLVIGKPLIIPRITEFHYRRDAYCRHQKTLQKVKTDCVQETLSKQVKEDLMKQNLSVPHLKRTIEHLEIALWFLSFGIGDPNQSLKLYITETLHINPDPGMEFPSYHLKHIISLWILLSVELGRKLVQEHQLEPFDLDQPCMDQKLNSEEKALLGTFTKEFHMYTALEILLEFILTFVKGSNGIIHAEWTIVETIEPALDESEDLAKFVETFPPAFKVGQAVDAWREIVHLHHKAYCI